MRRFLSRLSAREWALICFGLALIAGLEMAKPLAPRPVPATAAAADPDPDPQGKVTVLPDPTRRPAATAEDKETAEGDATAEVPPAAGPALPDPVIHPRQVRRLVHDIVRLTPQARAELDAVMADATYMTAFATGGNGATGWAKGHATPAAARAAALADCARGGATDCAVVAEVLPAGDAPPGDNSLTWLQGEAWKSMLRAYGSRALAVSPDGTWAAATADSGTEAAALATELCEGQRKPAAHLPPMPCRAIGVWDRGELQPIP